jgi:uncharacterized protein YukE
MVGTQFLNIFSSAYKATPLNFDQSLTTTEFLGALEAKINELVEFVNGLSDTSKEYTDAQITILSNSITSLQNTMIVLNNATKKDCNDYSDDIKTSLLATIKTNVDTINATIADMKVKDTSLQAEIQDIYDTLSTAGVSILVINPVTGMTTTVQNALNSIYNQTRETVTWGEIEAKNLTWGEIEALNKTWGDMEYNARTILNI